MSDEEKKAIEELKNKKADFFMISNLTGKTLLNLIEKQSKEIEHQKEKRENQKQELAILNAKQIEFNKLVNTVNSYKGQFKKQQKEIEELKEKKHIVKLTDNQIKMLVDIITDKRWEHKIKAKIEFIKSLKEKLYYEENVIDILQSLLEKE